MDFKKLSASLLAITLLAGCASNNDTSTESDSTNADASTPTRMAPAETGSKELQNLRLQFVPSRPADEIITATSGLGELLKEEMKKSGYTIDNVEISVSDSYEAAGEALSAGSVDIAWLPGGTYALYSEKDADVILTATRAGLSNDSENSADWNGEAHATQKNGPQVTYYKGLIYAGPSEYGKMLAEKVNKGEELTWDDLNGAKWGVRDITSSAGYIYPTMWLMNHFDGKKIGDLANVTEVDYANGFMQAASEQLDVIVCYADGRNDYENKWKETFGRTDSIWNELNVIGVTENIYNDTVAVTMNNADIYNKEFIQAFQDAMINIANTDAGKEIIKIYSHQGYKKANDADYDSARKALTVITK